MPYIMRFEGFFLEGNPDFGSECQRLAFFTFTRKSVLFRFAFVIVRNIF
jgi:hypothetical protein